MARLLVGKSAKNLRGVTCYDPSAGSGTLLMALAHQIGEKRCTIYSQDVSQKSSQMLRLNLILNNLADSIQNVVQGNTLLRPGHREADGSLRRFDYIISNPPFKLDFPDEYVVDKHVVYGCVSMPANVFATTGTNVSVLFFDNSRQADKVVLIDASKLGEEYKDGNNQRKRLRDFEIQKIVDTFLEQKAEDGFSVVVSHDEIREKGYTLSAGQYFDVKIDYVPITAAEFKEKVAGFKSRLAELNTRGAKLDRQIAANLDALKMA